MKELEYPFDGDYLLQKKKAIKKALLQNSDHFLEKKIAILGGSTTNNIKLMLELFLLNNGIKPSFYESEYNQFWEDAMFENIELREFAPDLIFIHTTNRNIIHYPEVGNTKEQVKELLEQEFNRFQTMWEKLFQTYGCPIIQNNFELPYYRLYGNKDAVISNGKVNFITKLNLKFAEYAENNEKFFLNDIHYQSSLYGLEKWDDPFYWQMYKYSPAVPAIPTLAYNVANIIKAIYGKNKKGLVLDLDNTLWGGVVGDDGPENIVIGQETSEAEAYTEFQTYLKELKNLGVILNVNSKNEEENALAGLKHPEGILRPEDFIVIKANWQPKSQNMQEIADELNLGVDSLVFVDDNPAEREIIRQHLPNVATPEIKEPEQYIQAIDRAGYFEVTNLSKDDLQKSKMYQENVQRNKQKASFADYGEYLKSLKMQATIKPFEPIYMARIAQLTNKSNQFNLTTKRYTQTEIEEVAQNDQYITLYGKLEDVFGDNGVVSVVIGHQEDRVLNMELWIMSCRVLKRDMEFAMMDTLVKEAKKRGIEIIRGFYYPTAKNSMVKDFYGLQGFRKKSEDKQGNATWELDLKQDYKNKNQYIQMEDKNE